MLNIAAFKPKLISTSIIPTLTITDSFRTSTNINGPNTNFRSLVLPYLSYNRGSHLSMENIHIMNPQRSSLQYEYFALALSSVSDLWPSIRNIFLSGWQGFGQSSRVWGSPLYNSPRVPVVPGLDERIQKLGEAQKWCEKHGLPVIFKQPGIRVVRTFDELGENSGRAAFCFANGPTFVERFIERPKHIEVQLMDDEHADVVGNLFDRDCFIQ